MCVTSVPFSHAPSIAPSPSSRAASPKTSTKPRCGCGPIARYSWMERSRGRAGEGGAETRSGISSCNTNHNATARYLRQSLERGPRNWPRTAAEGKWAATSLEPARCSSRRTWIGSRASTPPCLVSLKRIVPMITSCWNHRDSNWWCTGSPSVERRHHHSARSTRDGGIQAGLLCRGISRLRRVAETHGGALEPTDQQWSFNGVTV
jgi:hypothetical protein